MRFVATVAVLTVLLRVPAGAAGIELSAAQCPESDTLTTAERARVHCGMLAVPEDDRTVSSRTIELAVVIVDPIEAADPTPVLLLHGGPGSGVTGQYRNWLAARYGHRRVIAFDQRGVGRSRPALCPQLGDELFEASTLGLDARSETARVVAAYRRCHAQLASAGVDLSRYNTDATVADIERLREALRVERWHVYGVSYGTTVGLAYLREHPEHIRSLTLNSVLPLDAPEAANAGVNLMRSLREVSRACDAQAACRSRFGSLETLFLRTSMELAAEPLAIPGARAGERTVKLSASAYIAVIHQLLYDTDVYPALPMLMDRVAARDGEALALLVGGFRERVNSITHGEEAAVECFERAPFDTRAEFLARTSPWPAVREYMTALVAMLNVCAAWPERAERPMQMPPSGAGVPTLVLAGSWDPITPPADSKATADRLGAYYVESSYTGHGERDADCVRPISNAYFDDPSRAPDTTCIGRRRPPVFVTRLVRAPALARAAAQIAADPLGWRSLVVLMPMVVVASALAWPLAGLFSAVRRRRLRGGVWREPAVLLALAAVAILAWSAAMGWLLQASDPVLSMIGVSAGAVPLFILPWIAMLVTGAGAVRLMAGRGDRERHWLLRTHRVAVCCAALWLLALLARAGLLWPSVV